MPEQLLRHGQVFATRAQNLMGECVTKPMGCGSLKVVTKLIVRAGNGGAPAEGLDDPVNSSRGQASRSV